MFSKKTKFFLTLKTSKNMANIQTKGKSAPHVDMTPMVDLGFLLITFFMLASSFMKAKSIQMLSPAEGPDNPSKCSKTLTIMLDKDDKIKYYVCPESSQPDSTDFSKEGIRKVLIQRKKEVQTQWGNDVPLVVLVKPQDDAKYKRLIDVIDEINITKVQFTLAKIDQTDSTIFQIK
jgi:biopolymer transport protein ExbD